MRIRYTKILIILDILIIISLVNFIRPYKMPRIFSNNLNKGELLIQLNYENDFNYGKVVTGNIIYPYDLQKIKNINKDVLYLEGNIDDFKHADMWDSNIFAYVDGYISGVIIDDDKKTSYKYYVKRWTPKTYITRLSMKPDQTFFIAYIFIAIILSVLSFIYFIVHFLKKKFRFAKIRAKSN